MLNDKLRSSLFNLIYYWFLGNIWLALTKNSQIVRRKIIQKWCFHYLCGGASGALGATFYFWLGKINSLFLFSSYNYVTATQKNYQAY